MWLERSRIDQQILGCYNGHNKTSWEIHQSQYCAEILKRFKYAHAYMSIIPMETNTRFTSKDVSYQDVCKTDRHHKEKAIDGNCFFLQGMHGLTYVSFHLQ